MKNSGKPVRILLLVLLFYNSAAAQVEPDYAVHANIIYRFTKYVNWPEDKKNGDFIIGVVNNNTLYEQLKSFVNNKAAGSQRIVIKKFAASASSFPCHILFIGEEASSSLKKIAGTTGSTPTLLVTEAEGLAKKGSCINFVIVQDHLKLEINKENINDRNLDIANELLSLGKIVK
jgi:hypothetical protein